MATTSLPRAAHAREAARDLIALALRYAAGRELSRDDLLSLRNLATRVKSAATDEIRAMDAAPSPTAAAVEVPECSM